MFDTSNEIKIEAQNIIGAYASISSSPNKGRMVTFEAFLESGYGSVNTNNPIKLSIFTGMIVSIKDTDKPSLLKISYIDPQSQKYLSSFLSKQSRSELETIINNV